MFQNIEERLIEQVERSLAAKYGVTAKVSLEQPKQNSFGELAIPIAFQLARQLRKPPRQIAGEIAEGLSDIPGVASVEIAGNGYINVRLDRGAFGLAALEDLAERGETAKRDKIIVEHTNINPNKAAHIGHLRNAVLGDTFVRMLRDQKRWVEVQNYIDNTGVQVADVVVGFHFLERKTLGEVQRLVADPTVRFDYLCWDLYARTSAYYKEHPEALEWRAQTLHAIEAGSGELSDIGHLVADTIVVAHLKTMSRLGIQYDVLPRESEILHLQFWATAFELAEGSQGDLLRDARQEQELLGYARFRIQECQRKHREEGDESEDDSKVIVRSNGTVTYVGKDIAYQLWKFGLLGKDFFYRPWSTYPNGHQVWVTTDRPGSDIRRQLRPRHRGFTT